jgi:hypothetical protein
MVHFSWVLVKFARSKLSLSNRCRRHTDRSGILSEGVLECDLYHWNDFQFPRKWFWRAELVVIQVDQLHATM